LVAQKGFGNFAAVKAGKPCGIQPIGNKMQILKSEKDVESVLSDGLELPSNGDNRAWTFPKPDSDAAKAGDGAVGKTCVSQTHELEVKADKSIFSNNEKATDELAVHTTFSVDSVVVPNASQFKRGTNIQVNLKNLHFTCRPKKVQLQISQAAAGAASQDAPDAAVSGTKDLSSHRGITNKWLHDSSDDRLKNLAGALGIKTDPWDDTDLGRAVKAGAKKAIDDALQPYGDTALEALQTALTNKFKAELKKKLSLPDENRVDVNYK
jgi:hypothetical protein